MKRGLKLTGYGLAAAALAVGAHAFSGLTAPVEAAGAATLSNDKVLSKSFNNATAKEVFDWMKSQKLNFVVDVTKIPDRRLTLNFEKVSGETAIRAISRALGFGWAKEGEVYVISENPLIGFSSDDIPRFGEGFNKSFGEFMPFGQDKNLGPGFQKFYEMDIPFFGKLHEGKGDSFNRVFTMPFMGDGQDLTPEQKKQWEKWGKEFGDQFKNWNPLTPEQMKEMTDKGIIQLRGPDGKSWKELSPEQRKQMEESLSRVRIYMDEHMGDMKKRMEELHKNFDGKIYQIDPKNYVGSDKAWVFKPIDVKKLKESLSDSQKKVMKEKGYLELSDLTDAQKKMLGDLPPTAKVKIKLDGDNSSISITTDEKKTESKPEVKPTSGPTEF